MSHSGDQAQVSTEIKDKFIVSSIQAIGARSKTIDKLGAGVGGSTAFLR